jgi:gliding motility-associated-like protein
MRLIFTLISWLIITTAAAQCDVELTNVNFETGDIQIVVHNSNGCGNGVDTTYIDHIDLGISNGVDTLATNEFASFPLHSFLDFQEQHFNGNLGNYAYSGDTLNFNMAEALNANVSDTSNPLTILERWMGWYNDGTFCEGAEVFIWQINYSNGPQALNPDWYNPIGTSQDYPDDNPWDNILPVDGLCPCDTIYIYETDTVVSYDTIIEYINTIEYVYDTTYVTLPPDTVYEYIYVTDTIDIMVYSTDTVYVEIVVYENVYIYETDTVTEYVVETVYVDCETGEACDLGFSCDETSIFAPNAVTPNGDGWNDTWQVTADGACWDQWEVRIYNRWGGLVWISASSLDEWEADVATGVYVYTITAHSAVSDSVFEFNGTITVLY